MHNIICNGVPSTIEVCGTAHKIETGFRTWIQIARLLESDLDPSVKISAAIAKCFGEVISPVDAAYEAAILFLNADKIDWSADTGKKSYTKSFDWDVDQKALVADFEREYGIDLTDPAINMHWWRFLALFGGLSDTSKTMQARGYRTVEIPHGASDAEKNRLRELKKAYALPAKTREEAIAQEREIWGD